MFFSLWLWALRIVFFGTNTTVETNTTWALKWQPLHLGGHLDISGCTYVNVLTWSFRWKHKFEKLPLLRIWRLYEHDRGLQFLKLLNDGSQFSYLVLLSLFTLTSEKCTGPTSPPWNLQHPFKPSALMETFPIPSPWPAPMAPPS